KTAIDQLSVLINQILKQRLTETENRRTFVLRMALQRVNHFSRIGQRHVAKNFHLSGFTIDFDFSGTETDFPKRRRETQWNIVISWDLEETASPDLPFRFSKMPLHDLRKAKLLLPADDHSIIQADFRYRHLKHRGGGFKKLPAGISSRFLYGLSHNRRGAARIRAFIEGRVM